MFYLIYYGTESADQPEVTKIETNGVQNVSYVNGLFYPPEYSDYYVFEHDGIDMSEIKRFCKAENRVGYISNKISNEDGDFTTSEILNMSVNITLNSPVELNGIGIRFNRGYAKALHIQCDTSDGVKVFSFNPADENYFAKFTVYNCYAIRLSFGGTNNPFSFIKIDSLYFLVTQKLDDNFEMKSIEEFNPLSNDLSIGELNVIAVQNDSIPFIAGRKLELYNGLNNTLLRTYYVVSAEKQLGDRYKVKAQDSIGRLADAFSEDFMYGGFLINVEWNWDYANQLVYYRYLYPKELPDYLKARSGINVTFDPAINKDALTPLFGYMEQTNCREYLVNVLFTTGLCVKVKENGDLYLFRFDNTKQPIHIDDGHILGDVFFEEATKIGKVIYDRKFYMTRAMDFGFATAAYSSEKNGPDKVYDFDNTSKTISNKFDAPKDIYVFYYTIEDGERIYEVPLDQKCLFFAQNSFSYKINDTNPAGYEVKIWDNDKHTYTISETISQVNETQEKKYSMSMIPAIPNELYFKTYGIIENDVAGRSIIDRCIKYNQSRGIVKASVICNDYLSNLSLGDIITITTSLGENIRGVITSMEIDFSGDDRVSDIEIMEWSSD